MNRVAMIAAACAVACGAVPAEAAITIRTEVTGVAYTKPGCIPYTDANSSACMAPEIAQVTNFSVVLDLPDYLLTNGLVSGSGIGTQYGSFSFQGNLSLPFYNGIGTDFVLQLNDYRYNPYFRYTGTAATFSATREGQGGFSILVTPVPEPATWTLMIFGFAAVGYTLRRHTRQLARIV